MSDLSRVRTLLIVDDEPELVEILADEFTGLGVNCIKASNASDALLFVNQENPDAVLSDINMPGLSGLDMLAKLKERQIDVPVVFLTGYGDKEKVTTALRLGAMDFHEKPYERQSLCTSILKALELGSEIKKLDAALVEISRQENIPPEHLDKFLQAQRVLFRNRKLSSIYLKKSG